MIRRHVGYVRAESWAEALHMMATDQQVCRPLAGGTDLLVQAHKGQVTWDLLVDISQIAELRVVAEESPLCVVLDRELRPMTRGVNTDGAAVGRLGAADIDACMDRW